MVKPTTNGKNSNIDSNVKELYDTISNLHLKTDYLSVS